MKSVLLTVLLAFVFVPFVVGQPMGERSLQNDEHAVYYSFEAVIKVTEEMLNDPKIQFVIPGLVPVGYGRLTNYAREHKQMIAVALKTKLSLEIPKRITGGHWDCLACKTFSSFALSLCCGREKAPSVTVCVGVCSFV